MNNLERLPTELLSVILNHVDCQDWITCALTSKTFYNETIPLIWRQIRTVSHDTLNDIINTITTSSLSIGQHIRSIDIHCMVNDTQLLTLIQHMPHLEHLTLTEGKHLTEISLQHLPRHCPRLRSLWMHNANLTTITTEALGQHCRQLTTRKLIHCDRQQDYTNHLFDALRDCPLQEIDLVSSHYSRISMDQPHQFDAETIALSLTTTIHLISLMIGHPTHDLTPIISTDPLAWPHMTHLTLRGCNELQDDEMILFIQSHPQLQHLEIIHASKITDLTLDTITAWLPDTINRVSMIGCIGITLNGICRLVKKCRVLKMGMTCSACDIYGDFEAHLPYGLYRVEPDYFDGPCQLSWVSGRARNIGPMRSIGIDRSLFTGLSKTKTLAGRPST